MYWNTAASAHNSNCRWFWQPPRELSLLRLLLAGLALLALCLAAIPTAWLLLLLSLVALDVLRTVLRMPHLVKAEQRQGLMQQDQQWSHWSAQHGWRPVKLLPNSLVWSWLVVLELKPQQGPRLYLALPWYVLPADDFRRLKVALRFSKH